MPKRPVSSGASGRSEPGELQRGSGNSNGHFERSAEREPVAASSWAARYGEVAIRDGMATIPWALYAYQGLLGMAAPEVWFISAILAHRWDAELPHPSLKQMAAQSGVSLRQLQNLRAILCAKGLLVVSERQGSNGAQQANSYDFQNLFARLDAAILADKPPDNPILDEDGPARFSTELADHSFVGRYGRVLAGAGVIAVPRGIYAYQTVLQLSPQDCWFIAYILAHKWTGDLPYPSLRKMAERTGYSVKQLHSIKEGLVECGLLRVVERYDGRGGRTSNGYDFAPLLTRLVELLRQETTAPDPQPAIATVAAAPAGRRGRRTPASVATEPASNGVQNTSPGGMQRTYIGGAQSPSSEGVQRTSSRGVQRTSSRGMQSISHQGVQSNLDGGVQNISLGTMHNNSLDGDAQQYTARDAEDLAGSGAESLTVGDAQRFTRRRTRKEDQFQAEDSNPQPPAAAQMTYSPYIARVVQDYSMEMGDNLHWTSNVSQALRLWQLSEIDEELFVNLMHDARRLVRQYQGKQGTGLIANKMAYYFQVLRDLLLGAEPVTAEDFTVADQL